MFIKEALGRKRREEEKSRGISVALELYVKQ